MTVSTHPASLHSLRLPSVGASLLILWACAAGKPIEAGQQSPDFVLELSPSSVSLDPGGTADFLVTLRFSDGTEGTTREVSFDATGGEIDGNGVFTAGDYAGNYRLIATLNGHSDTSTIDITSNARTLIGVRITPGSATIVPSGAQQFSATGVLSDGSDSTVAVDWSASAGTVDFKGTYTAPSQAGSYTVVATQHDGTLSDTAQVTVATVPPNMTAVVLTPPSVTLQFGQSQQFTAQALLSDGSTGPVTVSWTQTGGSITSNGRYTAGSNAGNFRVIARAANGKADTSSVTIASPTVTSVVLSPSSAALQTGQFQQFNSSITLSNGQTQENSQVTYTATGGQITQAGAFVAGTTPGTFSVIGTAPSGVADTSSVTITQANVVGLTITPPSASIGVNQSQQFTASATLSNGGTQPNPLVVWSATGGSINSSGSFTGTVVGTFLVIATQQGGGAADTVSVNVAGAPPSSMFFNSSETGCGSDANVLLCDDFEDGTWYEKNCDNANQSGGLLQTDGWCGTIYNNAGLAAGTGKCGNAGYKSSCAATTGVKGTPGFSSTTGNMADHALAQGTAEIWVRFYTKPQAGYTFGQEKWLTFNADEPGSGGIRWGNLMWNCGDYAQPTGTISMHFNPPMDICQKQNQASAIELVGGNWYFTEVHFKLNTPGQANGVFELWMDSCGSTGNSCPATPTLRIKRTDVQTDRANTGELIKVLWFEAWAEPFSVGERLLDQIKVSKVGPIGFMK